MTHVLLVEPDVVLARAYSRALQYYGHSVAHHTSGQTALMAIDTRRPEAIVLELQLLVHNGLEFLYELRSYADWQNIPVIMLGDVPKEEMSKGLDTTYLQPFRYVRKTDTSLQELCSIIDERTVAI